MLIPARTLASKINQRVGFKTRSPVRSRETSLSFSMILVLDAFFLPRDKLNTRIAELVIDAARVESSIKNCDTVRTKAEFLNGISEEKFI